MAQATRKKEYVRVNLKYPSEVHEFLNSEEVRRKMEELMEAQRDELTLRRYSIIYYVWA